MMRLPRWLQSFATAIIILLILMSPVFVTSPYYLHIMIGIFIDIVLALGMYSMWSIGLLNAAHPSFWGIGAYTSALLMMRAGLSFWLALPIAGIVAAIIAGIIGYAGLRVRGIYFVILTLALSELVRWIFTSWEGLFGGISGLANIPHPGTIHIFGLTIDFATSLVPYYYLALVVCLMTALVYFRIHRSRVGRIWASIRQSEELLAATGTSVFRQKEMCLVISCFFAGFVGAVTASFMGVVSPEMFTLWHGVFIFISVLVGGIGTPVGPIVGVTVMNILEQFLRELREFEPIVWGIMLILAMLFMRRGLVELPKIIINRIKTRP